MVLRSHVGFGAGIHYRLSAPPVRAEAEVALDRSISTIRHSQTRAQTSCACGHPKPEPIDFYHFLFDFEGDKIRGLKED
jgi:hypothetical protein